MEEINNQNTAEEKVKSMEKKIETLEKNIKTEKKTKKSASLLATTIGLALTTAALFYSTNIMKKTTQDIGDVSLIGGIVSWFNIGSWILLGITIVLLLIFIYKQFIKKKEQTNPVQGEEAHK